MQEEASTEGGVSSVSSVATPAPCAYLEKDDPVVADSAAAADHSAASAMAADGSPYPSASAVAADNAIFSSVSAMVSDDPQPTATRPSTAGAQAPHGVKLGSRYILRVWATDPNL